MIYNIYRFILLLLPYWLVIQIHRANKAIPANIKTRTGKTLKAVMVTNNYGILYTSEEYIVNRVKLLREEQNRVNEINSSIAAEMNSLSAEARDLFFEEESDK